MTRFKNFVNAIRYAFYRKYIQAMPYSNQLEVAKHVYDIADECYKGKLGDKLGVCTVNFQCPYEGHVSYHCNSTLARRKGDEGDILSDYVIENLGKDNWRLTVVVSTSDDNAHLAADAVAMSAVLCIPTVLGDFNRSYSAVASSSAAAETKVAFC